MDSICNVTMKYALPQVDKTTVNYVLTGPMVDGGKADFLIRREPAGSAIVGALKLQ